MNRIILAATFLALILFIFGCCFNPGSLDTDYGSLTISLASDLSGAKTITPPVDISIASYDIHGYGPNGAVFERVGVVGDTIVQHSLVVGAWQISVDGKNASGVKIAMGSAQVTITAGQTASCNITVSPLTGNGILQLVVTWPEGVLVDPSVTGTLTPSGGNSTDIYFTLSEDQLSAFYSNGSCPAGYYTLALKLLEGSEEVWGAVETVRVLADNATQGTFNLTVSDIKGKLNVQITPILSDPIQILLSGQLAELDWGKNMTITATPSAGVDSFQWYLDGSVLSGQTNPSITIGCDLEKGQYRLDLVATTSNVLSSTHHSFAITPVSIDELISQIDESEIYDTTYDLQNFITRRLGYTGNTEASTYLFERLTAIEGLQVEFQGGTYRNVIATLPGADKQSDAICIVGAHYDSISSDPANAPGATDNGCGVGLVLEFARILSQYKFNNTIDFALWNDEEDDSQGSSNFVASAYQASLNIILYLNLDSAGYDPNNRFILDIMYNSKSDWISDLMTENNTLYGTNFTLTYNVHTCWSDHRPFWNMGYTAVMTHSESHGPAHSPNDTIDKISTLYAKKNGQLQMSVLAQLAAP
jgi:hypothetical protein